MISLLIVDDEKTTRDSLKEYISWNELGVDLVATAKNGLDALKLAHKIKPDILLTDVRMPKMDGIKLASKIRELYEDCMIIFLSGYSDKEYLKKAIYLQAISYIEKPISIKEIRSVVRRTVQEYHKRAVEKAKKLRLRESLAKNLPLIRQEIAAELVRGETNLEDLAEKYGEAFVSLPSAEFFTPVCLIVNWDPVVDEAMKTSLKRVLLELLSGEDSPNFFPYLMGFEDDDKIILILASHRHHDQTTALLKRLLERKLADLSTCQYCLSAGIGSPVREMASLPESYRLAVIAANTQFYSGPGSIFAYCDVAGSHFEPKKDLYQHFRVYLSKNDMNEAIELVNKLTNVIKFAQEKNINRVKNIYFNLLLIVFEVAKDRGFINLYDENEKNYIWQEIERTKTLAELSAYIISNIESVFSTMEEQNAVHSKIYEITTYIKENYTAEDLSVQSIARHTYLSYTYLCAFFKKNTGKTINEYITEVRIEKAKELLREGRMRLYEIASSIGYTDPNYFSSLFKKHTGYTPSEFKEKTYPC